MKATDNPSEFPALRRSYSALLVFKMICWEGCRAWPAAAKQWGLAGNAVQHVRQWPSKDFNGGIAGKKLFDEGGSI